LIQVLGLIARSVGLSSQDGSPAADEPRLMSVEETRAAIDACLTALVAREDIAPFFADDALLVLADVNQVIEGRDTVAGAIVAPHQQTFDAPPEVTSLIVGEGAAAIEAVFVGTHTGEFAGIPATGKEVLVPYAVFYELIDGKITVLRIHGFVTGLMAALSAEATSTAATPAP
jgi:predicted ester cyclase